MNTALGYNAGRSITTGSKNTILGALMSAITTGDNNTVIGHAASVATGTASNQISIHNLINATGATGVVASGVGAGNVGIGTTDPQTKFHINTGGVAGTPVKGFMLQDGNEKNEGWVLTTGADGLATWKPVQVGEGADGNTITVVEASNTPITVSDPIVSGNTNTYKVGITPGDNGQVLKTVDGDVIWVTLPPSEEGKTYDAENGITLAEGDVFKLGGALTDNTNINTNGKTFEISGEGDLKITTSPSQDGWVLTSDGTGISTWKELPKDTIVKVVQNAPIKVTESKSGNIKTFTVGVTPGAKGQVLTTDNTTGTVVWQDAPAAIEPWFVRPTGTASANKQATSNTEDAYLRGAIAVGFGDKNALDKWVTPEGFPKIRMAYKKGYEIPTGQDFGLFAQGNALVTNDFHAYRKIGIGTIQDDLNSKETGDVIVPEAALHILCNNATPGNGDARSDITIESYRNSEVDADGVKDTPTLNFKAFRGTMANPKAGPNTASDEIGRINFWQHGWGGTNERIAGSIVGKYWPDMGTENLQIEITGHNVVLNTYSVNDENELGGTGTVYVNGDLSISGNLIHSTGMIHPSDRRLKTNIAPVKYGLSEIMKLQPVNYEMIKKPGVERIGFIAQEVKEVLPELVGGTEGDLEKGETLSIAYSEFAPVLTKAIQEQQAQIEEQQKQITALLNLVTTQQKLNEELNARLKALEETK